jgi:hypothetical protein
MEHIDKKYIFMFIGVIIGIIIMFILFEIKKKCILGFGKDAILDKIIKILIRQSARWSTASKQDENPMIAVLHANYGSAYLWALKDIATSEQIKYSTGINLMKFERDIVNAQDIATKKMVKTCPSFAPEKTYLTEIAQLN